MDVYFVTGTWTKSVSDNEGRDLRGKLSNRLFKNNGNGTFTDVTEQGRRRRQGHLSRAAARPPTTTTTATSISTC